MNSRTSPHQHSAVRKNRCLSPGERACRVFKLEEVCWSEVLKKIQSNDLFKS
jgi:hypothetical protein